MRAAREFLLFYFTAAGEVSEGVAVCRDLEPTTPLQWAVGGDMPVSEDYLYQRQPVAVGGPAKGEY